MKLRIVLVFAIASSWTVSAQRPFQGQMDEARARQLYVSKDPKDHSHPDFKAQIDAKAKEDARYAALCAAIVPVTNLVFRLSYKGPGYQRDFATQQGIQGLPFEKREEYSKRSPLYHVDKLTVPVLVHVATNDTDVDFVEDQQIVDALRSRKPDLAETKVYVDPAPGPSSGGHTFSRRVNRQTLEREDSPEQIDSWNRTWVFFEWNLRPYEDRSKTRPTSHER